MEEMNWHRVGWAVLFFLITLVGMYLITAGIQTSFPTSAIVALYLLVFFILVVTAAFLRFFVPESGLWGWALGFLGVFLCIMLFRGIVTTYSTSAMESMDRGIAGFFLFVGKKADDPTLATDTVNHDANKLCNNELAVKQKQEEDYARIAYQHGQTGPHGETAEEYYSDARQKIADKYSKALKACSVVPTPPPTPEVSTNTAPQPAPKPALKKKPVARNYSHCRIICRG